MHADQETHVLLAMQKVEGSNPFSRFEKGLLCRSFSLRRSPCSSASGRTDSGLAVRRSAAASRKTPGLQADSRSSELKSLCRPAGGRVFARCGRWRAVSQTARSCARTPVGAPPAIRILRGESDFSPDTVRSTSARTATPARRSSHRREPLRRSASEAAARYPSRAAWAVAIARGHDGWESSTAAAW
jgi:hypothetical protein